MPMGHRPIAVFRCQAAVFGQPCPDFPLRVGLATARVLRVWFAALFGYGRSHRLAFDALWDGRFPGARSLRPIGRACVLTPLLGRILVCGSRVALDLLRRSFSMWLDAHLWRSVLSSPRIVLRPSWGFCFWPVRTLCGLRGVPEVRNIGDGL